MDSHQREILSVAEQAAEWVSMMRSADPENRVAFWKWMAASPLHVREMLLAVKLDQELATFDRGREIDVQELIARSSSNISRITRCVESFVPKPRRWKTRSWLLTAVACGALLAFGSLTYFVQDTRETYVTRLGEQRIFELGDGSVIFLNTQSRVNVRFSAHTRDVYLPEGQALFQVAHDAARPFRVHAAAAVIQAIGTEFDVRILPDSTMVAVIEGTVQISPSKGASDPKVGNHARLPVLAKVAAGEGATINTNGQIRSARIEAASVAAWRHQRLVFNNQTLGWIVDEFNRYNVVPRLRVDDGTLRSRRFNGVFNAHSPESLLKYLARDESITFERRGDEIIIVANRGS